jgi:hypothetical protein
MAIRSATKRVRESVRAQIGQVIVNWAHLEWQLSEAIYLAARVDPKIGRLIVELPKAKDRVKIIERLLQYRRINVSSNLERLRNGIAAIEEERNKLAHGVWVRMPGHREPWLRVTIGKLDSAKYRMTGENIRKMFPEPFRKTTADIRKTASKIAKLCGAADRLRREIKKVSPPVTA